MFLGHMDQDFLLGHSISFDHFLYILIFSVGFSSSVTSFLVVILRDYAADAGGGNVNKAQCLSLAHPQVSGVINHSIHSDHPAETLTLNSQRSVGLWYRLALSLLVTTPLSCLKITIFTSITIPPPSSPPFSSPSLPIVPFPHPKFLPVLLILSHDQIPWPLFRILLFSVPSFFGKPT